MSLANKHEKYRKYGLGFPGLVSGTEQLSVDDHVALSPRSDHDSASSVGSSEGRAPTFTESPPPSEIAVEEGGSKSTSRASSAEHSPPSLEVSIHRVDQCIISNAEVDGHKFDYHRVNPALVPEGWSNDPKDLEPFSGSLSTDEYSLPSCALPILALGGNEQPDRYLFSILGRFYLWTPASRELLYVDQLYKLPGILKRMHKKSFGFRTKPLQTLSSWNSQHQISHLPLWFWQVPRGWSQNLKKLKELKKMLDDGIEYGLQLPIPILVDDHGTEYFMKSGDRYYIYDEISGFLYRVEEPAELSQILRTLGGRVWDGLRLTECVILPEYGGPSKVPDEEVPPGWSNRIVTDGCEMEVFVRHDIYVPSLLLFREAGQGLPALYLVKGFNPSRYYIWDATCNKISNIEKPHALQDILDTLKGSVDELTLSQVEPKGRP